MLASTAEYFEALHAGNYLLFLDWISFVRKKYSDDKEESSSDSLMDCLVFEWLNHGVSEHDEQQMSILYAVTELDSNVLQVDTLFFSFTTLNLALFPSKAIQQLGLANNLPKTKMTEKGVSKFMENLMRTINKDIFSECINQIRENFINQCLTKVDKKVVATTHQKINEITRLLSLLVKYIDSLIFVQNQDLGNSLHGSRLALVRSLFFYLRAQAELNDAVKERIAEYTNAIREQLPTEWEETDYLQNILPQTFMGKITKLLTIGSANFFTWAVPVRDETNSESLITLEP